MEGRSDIRVPSVALKLEALESRLHQSESKFGLKVLQSGVCQQLDYCIVYCIVYCVVLYPPPSPTNRSILQGLILRYLVIEGMVLKIKPGRVEHIRVSKTCLLHPGCQNGPRADVGSDSIYLCVHLHYIYYI